MAGANPALRIVRLAFARFTKAVDFVLAHHRFALAVLALAQIIATAAFALTATHNGWLYFQGGDQIWYSTTAWSLGELTIPNALVGYGWPLVLAPITWLTGPTFVQALPLIITMNVVVLGPVALYCVYAIAERIGGRLLGLWSAVLWVVVPYLAIPLFAPRYHVKYVDQFLPQALGLTAMADFFSMVALLVGALFVLRSIERRSWADAVVAGVVIGFAGGAKPPNLLILGGAVLAYLGCRRPREAAAFGVAILPSLLTLVLWKSRGLGTVPLFSLGEVREALGSHPLAVPGPLDGYIDLNWDVWKQNMSNLREFFYSARLAQWAPIAGAVAVASRRPGISALLVGWLAAFLVIKGTSERSSIEGGTFFRLLMPAWPAYLLLLAAVPLLVPTLRERLGARVVSAAFGKGLGMRPMLGVVVVTAVIPLLVIAIARPAQSPASVVLGDNVRNPLLTPVDDSIRVAAARRGEAVVVTWSTPSWRAGVFYRVMRTAGDGPDTTCTTAGVTTCVLQMETLTDTPRMTYLDGSPPSGTTYRVGVVANYNGGVKGGDVFAFSPPVRVTR